MARPTMSHTVEVPAGVHPSRIRCKLRLVASTTVDAHGFVSGSDTAIGGTLEATPDNSGLVSFTNMRPNSGSSSDVVTSPTGTVYELTTTYPDGRRIVDYFTAPDTAGTFWVGDYLTQSPTAITSTIAAANVTFSPTGNIAATNVQSALADVDALASAATTALAGKASTSHATSHAPAGSDALPWTTINGYGTAASRPVAASTNAGYVYFATDTATLSRSNGATWDTLLAPGTTATTFAAGNDSRLSDTRTPTDGSVTNAKVSASAAIDLSKLATQAANTFVANGTAGVAVPTAITAATAWSVLSGAQSADVAFNSKKITGLANGTATGHAATWDQTPAGILTTQGDMLYASAANTPARLAKGTAYQVLRINSGATAPEWVSGGMHLIADTVLGADAASIDFTSIPATFSQLVVYFTVRSTRAGVANDYLSLNINNDSTNANYLDVQVQNGATSNNNARRLIAYIPGATDTAGRVASGTIILPGYSKTTFNKTAVSLVGRTSLYSETYHLTWLNTAAINRLTFVSDTGSNLLAGSTVSLYGVG